MKTNIQLHAAQAFCPPMDIINLQDLLQIAAQLCRAKAPPMAWADFKSAYYNFTEAERKPNTNKLIKRAVIYLEGFTQIKYLADITPDLLQNFKQHLIATRGNVSTNRYLRCIMTMMRWAEGKKFIAPQDWRQIKYLRESRGRLIFYTEEELKSLLSAAHGDWRLVILLGARAGLRRGEIAMLKWCDIDFLNNQIYIAPNKTDKSRYVPMSSDLRRALINAQGMSKSEFIINVGGCKRWDDCWLSSYFPKIRLKAGLGKKGSLHTLRHTFASHLVQNGVDLYTVSKLLGHSSIEMTEIYAHLAPKTLQTAVDKLPSI